MEGRIQTRQWEDDKKIRHWKTEIVANSVEMLSGRRKKDYATESAAEALAAQADAMGVEPTDDPASYALADAATDDESETAESEAAAA